MFSTGMSDCPVKYFKKFLSVLNPNQTALFQKPNINFLSSDKIWFENSPIGVNKLGDMMKEISPSLLYMKLEYPFIELCRLQATEARVALSRIVTDKA